MRRALGASRARLVHRCWSEALLLAIRRRGHWHRARDLDESTAAGDASCVDRGVRAPCRRFTRLACVACSPRRRNDGCGGERLASASRFGRAPGRSIQGLCPGRKRSSATSGGDCASRDVDGAALRGRELLERTRSTPAHCAWFRSCKPLVRHTALPSSSGSRDVRQSFYGAALERLRTIPGVERGALTSTLPLIPSGGDCVSIASGMRLDATASEVSPDYFGTLGIPLVSGHDFSPASLTSEPAAVIVNESLVRLAWPNESPIGKSIDLGMRGHSARAGLGVVGDTAVRRIGERPSPHVYRQIMREAGGTFTTIVLAVNGDPAALTRPVRDALIGLGKGVRVYEVQPLAVPVEQSYAAPRWLTASWRCSAWWHSLSPRLACSATPLIA